MPLASVINWVTADLAVANGAIIPVEVQRTSPA